MARFLAVLLFCGAGFAQTLKPVEVVTTNKVEMGPGGTIHIVGSQGELNVEAWERAEVEVTVTRFNESEDKDRDAVKKSLEGIAVETKKSGANDVTVTTPKLHGLKTTKINYRIRAPKDAKLEIRHLDGDVVITGLSGGIDAHAKNAEIFVMLPPQGAYAIQAKAKLGTIYSEFDGTRKHTFPFGNSFEGKAGDSGKAVNLFTENGGVTVQKLTE